LALEDRIFSAFSFHFLIVIICEDSDIIEQPELVEGVIIGKGTFINICTAVANRESLQIDAFWEFYVVFMNSMYVIEGTSMRELGHRFLHNFNLISMSQMALIMGILSRIIQLLSDLVGL
jgi:hypothetical protein